MYPLGISVAQKQVKLVCGVTAEKFFLCKPGSNQVFQAAQQLVSICPAEQLIDKFKIAHIQHNNRVTGVLLAAFGKALFQSGQVFSPGYRVKISQM